MTLPYEPRLNQPEPTPAQELEAAQDARKLLENMIQVKGQKLINDIAFFGDDDNPPDEDMTADFVRDNFKAIERGMSELRMLMAAWVGPSRETLYWAQQLERSK
jgi:hypothetical protein